MTKNLERVLCIKFYFDPADSTLYSKTNKQNATIENCYLCSQSLIGQLFGHVADRLMEVRKTVLHVLQSRFEHFASFPQEVGLESTKMLSGQIESLRPVFAYIEQVSAEFSRDLRLLVPFRGYSHREGD